MLYWIIYDISENSTRSKIIGKCKDYGLFRIQKSAFIGDLSRNRAEALSIELKSLCLKELDCVFMIPSCASCFNSRFIIGNFDEERLKQKDFVIVG